ncbi:MAG: hypothetical protein ABIQ30_02750 [Devosia sp.]
MLKVITAISLAWMLAALTSPSATGAEPSEVAQLQHILSDAGFGPAGQSGEWSDATTKVLTDFAARYGIARPTGRPSDSEVAAIVIAARTAVDADYEAYPTGQLPPSFFAGVGSHVMADLHSWAYHGVKNVDGRPLLFPITRFFETTDEDIVTFKAEGVGVIRMLVNVDAMLFWKECDYKIKDLELKDPLCYDRAYTAAAKAGWKPQAAAVNDMKGNPIMTLAAGFAARFNAAGLHVIFTPSDFFFPAGGRAKSHPLLHTYLEKDKALRQVYVRLVGAMVGELRDRDIANISLQSLNEPRYCALKTGLPVKDGLKLWTALERQVFDAARQVAPRLSLISGAICTAGDQYFSRGEGYADIDKLMPIHADLEGISYSLHIRTPRMLLIGGTGSPLKPGTVVHYPYQPLSESVSATDKAEVQTYNKIKPDAAFYERAFSDLEAFAKAKNIRILITEFDMQKPSFGTTADDRFRLVRDVFTAAKAHDVPIVYYSIVDQPGLSSCASSSFPDHRYDPNLLRLIGVANGVPGESVDAPMVAVEAVCGNADTSATSLVLEHSAGDDLHANALFATLIGATGAEVGVNIDGRAASVDGPLTSVHISFNNPITAKEAQAAAKCGASSFVDNGENYLDVLLIRTSSTYNLYSAACIVSALSGPSAAKADFALHHVASIAKQMADSGTLAGVATDVLRNWLQGLADGTLTFNVTDDPSPFESATIEGFNHGDAVDLRVDTLLKTTLFKAGKTVPFNVSGHAAAGDKPLDGISLTFQDAITDKQAVAFKKCGAAVAEFEGAKHAQVSLQRRDTAFNIYAVKCIEVALRGTAIPSVIRDFPKIVGDMGATGGIEAVSNDLLRNWLQAVSDGKITVAAIDDPSPFKTSTIVAFDHGTPEDLRADTLFASTDLRSGSTYQFNISGHAAAAGQPFDQVTLQFFETLSDKQAAALQSKCGGEAAEFDGEKHARLHLVRSGETFTIYSADCYGPTLGTPAGKTVSYVVENLSQIISDMAAMNALETVPNLLLRGWLQEIADGKAKLVATRKVPPPRETSTFEEFSNKDADDPQFNSLLKTNTRSVGEIAYNVRGKSIGSTGVFVELAFVLANATSDTAAKALSSSCAVKIDSWDDGSNHAQFEFAVTSAGGKITYTLPRYDCITANLDKGDADKLDFLLTQFGQVAIDMVESGNVNGVMNLSLREFMKGVAEGRLKIETKAS